jgi:hypothetical protein
MRLSPFQFASTMAWFFFAINLSKWIPYAWLGLLDARNMATSLALLPLVPVGVWVGLSMAKRISPKHFYRLIAVGMFLTGSKLLWDAFA